MSVTIFVPTKRVWYRDPDVIHSAYWDLSYRVDKYRPSKGGPQLYESIATEPNKIVNTGLTHLLRLAAGELSTTLNNANAQLGSGDSTTAAAAAQTNLQAATNKGWVAMDASYPTAEASQSVAFRSTMAAGVHTWTWQEVGLARGDPGASGILIGRKVQSFGAKAAGDAWIFTGNLAAASAS